MRWGLTKRAVGRRLDVGVYGALPRGGTVTVDQPGSASHSDGDTADQDKAPRQTGTRVPLVWEADPTELALEAAGWRRDLTEPKASHLKPGRLYLEPKPITPVLDEEDEQRLFGPSVAFCSELGRQLLLYQFTFSSWVLRRVEKVHFQDEFSLARRTSIELLVPHDAPTLRTAGGAANGAATTDCWLVPLSVMRRRTLVNLDIRDEDGGSISLLGLRFTQKLDEAMLRAAAKLAVPGRGLPARLEMFIEEVVSGGRHDVSTAKERVTILRRLEDTRDYFNNDVFNALSRACGTTSPCTPPCRSSVADIVCSGWPSMSQSSGDIRNPPSCGQMPMVRRSIPRPSRTSPSARSAGWLCRSLLDWGSFPLVSGS